MRTAIATVCLSGTLDEKLAAIAAAGFKCVELFENDLLSFSGKPAEVRRMFGDLGLEIVTFQPFRDFEGMPGPLRDKALSRAERKFDLMQELGCDLLMVCSNVSPDALGGIDRAAEDLRALGERAATRNLRVAFEALAWGRHINDYRDAWEVVRRANHPSVGLTLDSFHSLVRRTELATMRSIPSDRIFLVQMADAPLLEMDFLSWSRHYRCFPGQGELAIGDFMQALGATGFDGLLSLEIFSDRVRAGSARSVAVDGRRSLLVLTDELESRPGIDGGHRTKLPPRAVCHGVEFIEFAIDEKARPGFEASLAALGFSKAGQHRSKAVVRWRQGDINIVVNAEADGFAHSYQLLHGSGVCAIALRVADASAAIDRAVALLDQPFHQAIGPGELDIPAVRGLGGSLIYFVDSTTGLDRLWDVDFLPLTDLAAPLPGAGVLRVDHVQQAMRYEEMLSWLLFYSSLITLERTAVVDVVDPGGVVQSQALTTPDGALRLAFNASQSQQTLASRFLTDRFGAGFHHAAFATGDIFATAARLRERGVSFLPIPENYYDDLEARSDLSVEDVGWLKQYGILYDRNPQGEFYQLYTRDLLEDGFFFEIVERRGDYAGFGAINASIRLAAQTLLHAERHPS